MTLLAVWLAVALLAGIVEMIVPALVCLFVALAALLAAALAWLGASAAVILPRPFPPRGRTSSLRWARS